MAQKLLSKNRQQAAHYVGLLFEDLLLLKLVDFCQFLLSCVTRKICSIWLSLH